VTATDDVGASTTQTAIVRVSNSAPTIAEILVRGTPTEGAALNFSATVVNLPGEPLAYLWNFGDGGGSSLRNSTHTFGDQGNFTVRLVVSDGEGGQAVLAVVVRVANAPPELSCQVCPTDAVQGEQISIRAHGKDPGRNDSLTYRLVLPDGRTISSPEGSFDFVLQEAGDAVLNLTADDSQGGTTTIAVIIRVEPDFDRDGLADATDPDDDNDGVPDATDSAPHDPAVGAVPVSTPPVFGLGTLLLVALVGIAVALVVLARRRRREP
jgi:PKD repeat protein